MKISMKLLGAGTLFLLLALACGGYDQPTLAGPAIASFTAANTVITAGATTTLTADFNNGLGVVDQGVGPVSDLVPVTVKPSATTTYILTDRAAGGAYATRSLTVQVVPVPDLPVITPPNSVEPGQTGLQASVPAQADCTYLWIIDKSGGSITAGGTSPTVTFSTALFGELSLACAVTNLAGTRVTSTTLVFPLGGPTVESFAADPPDISPGGTSNLDYSFSGGAGVISSPGNPDLPVAAGTTSIEVKPSATTTYTFSVSDSKGEVSTLEATVTVVPAPTISLFTGSPAPGIVGTGADVQLIAVFDAGQGGNASVDNGVGAVESGVAVDVGTLEHSTDFILTAINAAGVETTATTRVLVGSLATLSGSPSGEGSLDGPAAQARYRSPAGMVVDSAGDLLVADTRSHTIRKITPEAEVSTLAGAEGVPGSADGVGAEARFNLPAALALDPDTGNVYVADSGNNEIRVVTPGGAVSTLAGPAGFSNPTGIAAGHDGNGPVVFVADTGNAAIRRIDLGSLAVTTLTGIPGTPGLRDGASGTALLNAPAGLAWNGNALGQLYLADAGNNSIRQVSLQGDVATVAGAPGGAAGSADGQGGGASFSGPQGLALDSANDLLYVADTGNSTLRRVAPGDGTAATLAGTPGSPGSADGAGALFNLPQGIVLNGGVLVVADTGNATLRQLGVDPEAGPAATYSGTHGNPGHADGPGLDATLRRPRGAALGASGALYVADSGNHTIRRISLDGTVSTLAGTAGEAGFRDGAGAGQALFNGPTAVAAGVSPDGSDFVIVADTGNHAMRKVLEDGTVTTLAGTGAAGAADSPAQFNRPAGVALDAAGDVLVADTGNQTLRRIAAGSLAVTTLAGTAGVPGSQDGAAGPGVSFNAPAGLAVAADGSLYVADSGNGTIRRLANGQVSTFAGKAGRPGSVDGTGTQAQLDGPVAVALDAAGNLFVANSGSSTVVVITPGALVATIIGGAGNSTNDPGPLPARISPPCGIAVDPSNANIYITIDDAVMLVDFTK